MHIRTNRISDFAKNAVSMQSNSKPVCEVYNNKILSVHHRFFTLIYVCNSGNTYNFQGFRQWILLDQWRMQDFPEEGTPTPEGGPQYTI